MQRSDEAVRQAMAAAAAGRSAEAVTALRRVVARDPTHARAGVALSELLARVGDMVAAAYAAERAMHAAPTNPDAINALGYCRLLSGRAAEAVALFERALTIDEAHMRALSNLCGALRRLDRLDEAVVAMRRMLAAHPDSEFAYADVNVLLQVGMAREAAATLRNGVERFPRAVWLRRDLCVALNYTDDAEENELLRAHAMLGASLPPPGKIEPIDPDPDRPLRIGYVSADFREHSVASFLRPLLDCAGDALIPVCFHCSGVSDAVTERLRGWVEGAGGEWHALAGVSNAELVTELRRDRLDIVVDLSGWTAGGRLFALAARAAPVQITYLGYPNTTGVASIDARMVDGLSDPVDAEPLATERLVRLDPCFLCYAPMAFAEEPSRPSPRDETPPTFGSFNSIRKITPSTVRLWAGAMNAVPGSRLVLKSVGLGSRLARQHLLDQFAAEGIGADRLELLDRVESRSEHLALYSRIDVALDTFPYHGTTTTCEALWMGVPVVTRAGRAHRSRVGVSLLNAAGLPGLVAKSEEEFARLAGQTAQNRPGLDQWRQSLREQVRTSPLCDVPAFRARFAGRMRDLWVGRCRAP